jgi:hypothetical protein
MQKPKQKINAKKFIEDFRSGKTDQDLMRLHELSPTMLEKIFTTLLAKGLLREDEIYSRHSVSDAEFMQPYQEPAIVGTYAGAKLGDTCPQCGASVKATALRCPECGHVLPGEERWERVEPKKRLVDRIHPIVLGIIIAIPAGVFLFFVFKDFIIPASESVGERRAQAVRSELPEGKTPIEAAKDLARFGARNIAKAEIQRLISDDILFSASADYTVFTAGSKWLDISDDDRMNYLDEIRRYLVTSGIPVHFKLLMSTGEVYAKVNEHDITLTRKDEGNAIPPGLGQSEAGQPAPAPPEMDSIPSPPRFPGRLPR